MPGCIRTLAPTSLACNLQYPSAATSSQFYHRNLHSGAWSSHQSLVQLFETKLFPVGEGGNYQTEVFEIQSSRRNWSIRRGHPNPTFTVPKESRLAHYTKTRDIVGLPRHQIPPDGSRWIVNVPPTQRCRHSFTKSHRRQSVDC